MSNSEYRSIKIESHFSISPIERNCWRTLGLLFNRHVAFNTCLNTGYIISYKGKSIHFPNRSIGSIYNKFLVRNVCFDNANYKLCSVDEVKIKKDNGKTIISEDIWTPVVSLLTLTEEQKDLTRDRCGLVIGSISSRARQAPENLLFDLLSEITMLFGKLLGLSIVPFWSSAPYAIAVTFDVDGFLPGQPEKLISFLQNWPVQQPTFMVMALDKAEATIYDPLYNLSDPSLKILWNSDVEIGLHSSYLAHDNPEYLNNQRNRLENCCGKKVLGHRSHYYRFSYPRSWGHQMRSGFLYDASLGYPDLPGLRNGTNVPIPFPDPDGFNKTLWTVATAFLDQHFFSKDSVLNWSGNGKEQCDRLLEYLRLNGGVLTLDWHVHGYDNANFPHHYDPLAYLLERASLDGALLTGLGKLIKNLDKRWRDLFEKDIYWEFERLEVSRTQINRENELESYVKTFSNVNLGATSIDSAMMSFLSILPGDAEKIIDIGSGPGIMSSRIPPFHKVLCMDLDERIVKTTSKPWCIGNITEIPLEDNAADLVMACDVLEHLTTEELGTAIKEIQRVSRRYIYVQVPFNEALPAGMLTCPYCHHVWHINYHKQSFDIDRILELFPYPWNAKIINFTGDVSWIRISDKYYQALDLFECHNVDLNEIVCPCCRSKYNYNEKRKKQIIRQLLSNTGKSQFEGVFPNYSEIGILFEYNGLSVPAAAPKIRTRNGSVKVLPQPIIATIDTIDFTKPYMESNIYNGFEVVPTVIPNQVAIVKSPEGITLYKSKLAQNPSVGISFPFKVHEGNIVSIQGTTDGEQSITILGYNDLAEEIVLNSAVINEKFEINIDIPDNKDIMSFFRITWDGLPALKLSKVSIKKQNKAIENEKYYIYQYPQSEFVHFEITFKGIMYRYLIPYEGNMYFSKHPNEWPAMLKSIKTGRHELLKYKQIINILEEKVLLSKKELHDAAINYKILETELIRQCKEFEQETEKLNTYICLLEEQLLLSEMEPKRQSAKRFLISPVKKILKKAVLYALKYPLLIAVGDRVGLRRVYKDLQRRGWV